MKKFALVLMLGLAGLAISAQAEGFAAPASDCRDGRRCYYGQDNHSNYGDGNRAYGNDGEGNRGYGYTGEGNQAYGYNGEGNQAYERPSVGARVLNFILGAVNPYAAYGSDDYVAPYNGAYGEGCDDCDAGGWSGPEYNYYAPEGGYQYGGGWGGGDDDDDR